MSRRNRRAGAVRALLGAAIACALLLGACTRGSSATGGAAVLGDDAITVGSYDFPESELLAEIYAQAFEPGGLLRPAGLRPRAARVGAAGDATRADRAGARVPGQRPGVPRRRAERGRGRDAGRPPRGARRPAPPRTAGSARAGSERVRGDRRNGAEAAPARPVRPGEDGRSLAPRRSGRMRRPTAVHARVGGRLRHPVRGLRGARHRRTAHGAGAAARVRRRRAVVHLERRAREQRPRRAARRPPPRARRTHRPGDPTRGAPAVRDRRRRGARGRDHPRSRRPISGG